MWQLLGILVFRPGAGGRVGALPGVDTIPLVHKAHGALALAALGGFLLGLGPLRLYAEHCYRLLQVVVILLDRGHRLAALVAALAAVRSKTEVVCYGVLWKPAVTTWLRMSPGSLLRKWVLKSIPSGSPGGSRASMVSMSWLGLLSPSSQPWMIFWQRSSGLGVKRSSSRTLRAL